MGCLLYYYVNIIIEQHLQEAKQRIESNKIKQDEAVVENNNGIYNQISMKFQQFFNKKSDNIIQQWVILREMKINISEEKKEWLEIKIKFEQINGKIKKELERRLKYCLIKIIEEESRMYEKKEY
ncbi:unnamed protein product [Paramecium sonneborni]|uniref:Uncharacterized protein n=1 Tax=Paramecium sonneborni TaxID=65129 RepID=A0A8S1QUG1_9CILI|nr:unnamed protein product [Paramecium sonneborni]